MSESRRRVVVAGAGVAGLETALALRAYAEDRVSVEVVAPEHEFAYRPHAVVEPFLAGEVQREPLEGLVRAAGADLRSARLVAVEAERKTARDETGSGIPYDVLVLAVGARTCEAVPGALTFRGPESGADIVALLAEATAGRVERIVFALPAAATWPLPLYELALLTAAYLAHHGGTGVEVVLVTPEPRPLAVFGPSASAAVTRLIETGGIQLQTAAVAEGWDAGILHLVGGAEIRADRVVALPRLEGPPIAGLPQDEEGFVDTDDFGRVSGLSDVYAAGDLKRSWIKQGGIAAQQADAAASAIARDAGADIEPTPFTPVLRGLLLTGSAPRFLRSEKGSSLVNPHPLWWPPSKIVGRHLTPFLAEHLGVAMGADEPPPADGLELEIAIETRDRTTWTTV